MFTRRQASVVAVQPQLGLQYRTTDTSIVIPRPREVVWAEVEQAHHPAWCGPDSGQQTYDIRGDERLQVGDAKVLGPFVMPPYGIRQVWWNEVTAVVPGWSVTSETYAGVFEHTETLMLRDHPEGTLARIHGSVRRVATPEHADHAVGVLQRLAEGHLLRAAEWRPGDPPRPIDVLPVPR